MPQCQKPLCLIHFWVIPFSLFLPLLPPSFLSLHYKEMVYYGRLDKKGGKVLEQNQFNRLQMVQFESPRVIQF